MFKRYSIQPNMAACNDLIADKASIHSARCYMAGIQRRLCQMLTPNRGIGYMLALYGLRLNMSGAN
ncbi:hypothetical protein D3C76_1568200 [compost metagenome]